jgi:cytochrome c biogenesis protein CcmG, thiol:disulfide interchange protein DsbE
VRAARPAALTAVLVLLTGCGSDDAAAPRPAVDVASAETDLAPCPAQPDQPAAPSDLPALRLDCFSGGSIDLGLAPGVPTVVNLWASWCPPCREELPVVQQLADAAGDRVRVLGVVSKDGVPQATSFAADAGATFPTAFDGEGELMEGLGIRALPYTYFLAADGSVAHVEVGAVESLPEFQQLLAEHLGVQL